ncbi:MAG: beta-N-acetylhexosaminidase [Halioglobus sp.]|nr:beta-N-acetylhexosaminidase [Halioglobus sp.]
MPDSATHSLLPLPGRVMPGEGVFTLTAGTQVAIDDALPGTPAVLRRLLGAATGFAFPPAAESVAAIRIQRRESLPAEAYRLDISPQEIRIEAACEAGALYALQTLRQLLAPAVDTVREGATQWQLPALRIEDQPRFAWRGMHLDVARHFMPVAFIKRFIDLLSLHKLNRFHWHLTDDQGWRIEIRRYPELTRVGSRRAQTLCGHPLRRRGEKPRYDGTPHGGFYTQDEVREVVAYAAARHVTVVPEIEFPGHAQAVIAAYPELGNSGRAVKVKEDWGISRHTLNPSEATLAFYRNVLTEVLELFPSPYIHIGGDEVLKREWRDSAAVQQRMRELGLEHAGALQAWLVRQVSDFLEAHGRRLVGWDDIAGDGLSQQALVMNWRGRSRGVKAARAGHNVVIALTSHTYFDYYQADKRGEPLALGFYLPLRRVYALDPSPASLAPTVRQRIVGVQGQLWTEFMRTPRHVEYMAFPRLCALAEVAWSPQHARNEDDFLRRLQGHLTRLDALGVRYRAPGNDAASLAFRVETWLWRSAMWLFHRFSR